MDSLVDCVDRWGRRIVLTEAQWHGHVLERRSTMAGHEVAVTVALTDPDLVMHDADDPDRECFYRRGALPGPAAHLYLKVTVDFGPGRHRAAAHGFVVTAYPTAVTKSKERSKWQC